jgi:hypothetical protein
VLRILTLGLLLAANDPPAETTRNTVTAAVIAPLVGFYAVEYERVLCRWGSAFAELGWLERATDRGALHGPSLTAGARLYLGEAPAGWWLFPEAFVGRRWLTSETGGWSRGVGAAFGYAWASCCLVVSAGIGTHRSWWSYDLRSGERQRSSGWAPFVRFNLGLAF